MLNAVVGITDLDKVNSDKIGYADLVRSLSQFLLLPQLFQKMTTTSKVFKSDSKTIISIHSSNSVVLNRCAAAHKGAVI